MVKSYDVEDSIPTTIKQTDVVKDSENDEEKVTKFRTVLPQILASTAKNLLLLDLGMSVSFPTIVIPALLNAKTGLSFTESQASWFGSIAYIWQPIGSIISGMILEMLGRKRSMLIVTLPLIAGWLLMHFAQDVPQLYGAVSLGGFGVGFMEAPIITYVGEICQPEMRGILTSMAGVSAFLGFFLTYLLGTLTDWRTAAAISTSVPILTLIAISLIPETPMWLLSKNRKEEALKSLCWLRGWVTPEHVNKEWVELQRYQKQSSNCHACQKSGNISIQCTHKKKDLIGASKEKLRNMIRKNTVKPFMVVLMFFFFSQFSGLASTRPFMVQIFKVFRVPIDAHWATVVNGLVGLAGNIACMLLIHHLGKRKIGISALSCCATCCILLGVWAHIALTPDASSINPPVISQTETSWIPWALFLTLAFATSIGVSPLPWMMLSEVFPYRTRGIASATAAAAHYVISFGATKSYLDLEHLLGLRGVFYLYGIISVAGCVCLFIFLPETEGKTLEEIEDYFAGRQKTLSKRVSPIGSVEVTQLTSIEDANRKGNQNITKYEDSCFTNDAVDLTSEDLKTEQSKDTSVGASGFNAYQQK